MDILKEDRSLDPNYLTMMKTRLPNITFTIHTWAGESCAIDRNVYWINQINSVISFSCTKLHNGITIFIMCVF